MFKILAGDVPKPQNWCIDDWGIENVMTKSMTYNPVLWFENVSESWIKP